MPDAESTRTFSRVTQLGLPSRGTAGGDSFSRSPGSQKSETRLRARRLCVQASLLGVQTAVLSPGCPVASPLRALPYILLEPVLLDWGLPS